MICERCGSALGEDDIVVCQPCSKALDGMFAPLQKVLDDPEVMAALLQHIEEEAEAS